MTTHDALTLAALVLAIVLGLQLNVLAYAALRYLQTPLHYRIPEILGGLPKEELEPEPEPQSVAQFVAMRERQRAREGH